MNLKAIKIMMVVLRLSIFVAASRRTSLEIERQDNRICVILVRKVLNYLEIAIEHIYLHRNYKIFNLCVGSALLESQSTSNLFQHAGCSVQLEVA
jgi:hypothetical protein